MSHFAELDSNKKVKRVLVGDNSMSNEGYDWILDNLGGTWVKTSYNGKIRKNFAGVGYFYDETRDAFISPQCHEEAILDEKSCQWNCNNAEHASIV